MKHIEKLVDLAIEEDIGTGDITTDSIFTEGKNCEGRLVAKQDLILSGLEPAMLVYKKIDPKIMWELSFREGDFVRKNEEIGTVKGPIASILKGERIALNFLQHLSGIATMTKVFVQETAESKIQILDTRKTTPGFRKLEKDAVLHGGGKNHRMGLYDMYLIKDNHIDAAGSITEAVQKIKRKKYLKIEIEVKDVLQIEEAVMAGADIVMLDNFTPPMIRDAVSMIDGRVKVEVSGNITFENIKDYLIPGVDYISIGSLTHSAPAADISMLF